jgi:glycosyltransferase involved in cell wall biosynthesis
MRQKKVTIKDVAARSGVSIATVSRFLNHTGYVEEETGKRILQAIEETNYAPSMAASSLKTHKGRIILLVVPDICNPFYSTMASTVQTLVSAKGYAMVLYNTNETNKIMALASEPVEAHLFQNNSIKLVGVGKLVPLKGFDRLLRIHHRLRVEGYTIHTYLLGTGPMEADLCAFIEENHLTDSVTFLGYQTNPYKYIAKTAFMSQETLRFQTFL